MVLLDPLGMVLLVGVSISFASMVVGMTLFSEKCALQSPKKDGKDKSMDTSIPEISTHRSGVM